MPTASEHFGILHGGQHFKNLDRKSPNACNQTAHSIVDVFLNVFNLPNTPKRLLFQLENLLKVDALIKRSKRLSILAIQPWLSSTR